MHTAINKAIRAGRTTMLAVGLAVSLALVLGVATVALAAVPGDPFKLGQVNFINNATTTLQGSGPGGAVAKPFLAIVREGTTAGPALSVDNTSSATGAKGITINVPNGKSPISANSGAGVAGLNVNLLDGQDSKDFVSASRLYSVGQLEPSGPGGGKAVTFLLRCDPGDVAIGGGGNSNDINDDLNNITPSFGSYQIEFQDNGDSAGKLSATIICSDASNPFRDR